MILAPFALARYVDEDALRAHLPVMAEGGTGVFVCSQGSGEGDLLSPDEKIRMYELGAEVCRGRVPIWAAGIGLGHSTREIVALARRAATSGVDGVYLLGPRPGPGGVRRHELERYFREVRASLDCPVII